MPHRSRGSVGHRPSGQPQRDKRVPTCGSHPPARASKPRAEDGRTPVGSGSARRALIRAFTRPNCRQRASSQPQTSKNMNLPWYLQSKQGAGGSNEMPMFCFPFCYSPVPPRSRHQAAPGEPGGHRDGRPGHLQPRDTPGLPQPSRARRGKVCRDEVGLREAVLGFLCTPCQTANSFKSKLISQLGL